MIWLGALGVLFFAVLFFVVCMMRILQQQSLNRKQDLRNRTQRMLITDRFELGTQGLNGTIVIHIPLGVRMCVTVPFSRALLRRFSYTCISPPTEEGGGLMTSLNIIKQTLI